MESVYFFDDNICKINIAEKETKKKEGNNLRKIKSCNDLPSKSVSYSKLNILNNNIRKSTSFYNLMTFVAYK